MAAILTWLLPGAGHLYIGHRARGLVFMVVIALTFWGGVAIGGVRSTVQPRERRAWFMAQVCTGVHAFATLAISRQFDDSTPKLPADDVAVVYTGIAGLLNVLVIFDVLSRGESAAACATTGRRGPTSKGDP